MKFRKVILKYTIFLLMGSMFFVYSVFSAFAVDVKSLINQYEERSRNEVQPAKFVPIKIERRESHNVQNLVKIFEDRKDVEKKGCSNEIKILPPNYVEKMGQVTKFFPLNDYNCRFSFEFNGNEQFNFGTVVYNKDIKVYRSNAPGKNVGELIKHIESAGFERPKTILYLHKEGYGENPQMESQKNKKKGSLFKRLMKKIKGKRTFAADEELMQNEFGYDFLHVGISDSFYLDEKAKIDFEGAMQTLEGTKLDETKNQEIVKLIAFFHSFILKKERQPILIHCIGGRHRTGLINLIIRYLEGGCWLKPYAEIRIPTVMPGYGNGFKKMTLNKAEYEYYIHNPALFKPSNITFVREFAKTTQFRELKEEFSGKLLQPSTPPEKYLKMSNEDKREFLKRSKSSKSNGVGVKAYLNDIGTLFRTYLPNNRS